METTKNATPLPYARMFALLAATTGVIVSLSGCSTLINSHSGTTTGQSTYLWNNNKDFIKLTPSRATGQQALDISATQVSAALSKLELKWNSGETGQVFPANELATISGPIAKGLRREQPGQDITFALTFRSHSANIVKNLFSPKKLTTGRIFYDGHDINVIFGAMHRSIERQKLAGAQGIDRSPGNRRGRLSEGWRIVTSNDVGVHSPSRTDWAVLKPTSWHGPGTAATSAAAPAASTQAKPGQGTTSSASASGQTPAATVQPGPTTSGSLYQSAREHLDALKKLRADGTITQKEYQRERAAILKALGSLSGQK